MNKNFKFSIKCMGFRCENEIPKDRKKLTEETEKLGDWPVFKCEFCSEFCEKDFVKRMSEPTRISGLGNIAPECDY